MKKCIALTIAGVLLLAGILGGIKFWQIRRMIAQAAQAVAPVETVTASPVVRQSWAPLLRAVGSVVAVQGVTVAAELPGKVVRIAFTSGDRVRKGDLLVQQDTSSEQAQLPGARAVVVQMKNNLLRAERMFAEKIISQADYDGAVAAYRQAVATAETIRATIGKKNIRAPFAGRLGIRQVNLGQILKEGDRIVSLQSLDPLFVHFFLPQQHLAQLRTGLTVRVTTDALNGETLKGKITAINPEVDAATRNIRVQVTLDNPRERLRPGMFVNLTLVLPVVRRVLAIPATAVLYAPYGNSVFVIQPAKGEQGGSVLRQQFVHLGESRGDFIAVTAGLKAGEMVASSGVFKLRNGQTVVVDNTHSPQFKLDPRPTEE